MVTTHPAVYDPETWQKYKNMCKINMHLPSSFIILLLAAGATTWLVGLIARCACCGNEYGMVNIDGVI